MARVAVAYVEIRPDLSQFSTLLKTELGKLGIATGKEFGKNVSKSARNEIVANHLWDATKKVAAKSLDDQVGLLDRFGKSVASRAKQRESEMTAMHREALKQNEAIDKASYDRRVAYAKQAMAESAALQMEGIKEREAIEKGEIDAKIARQRYAMEQMKQDIIEGINEETRIRRKSEKDNDAFRKAMGALGSARVRKASRESGARSGRDWSESFAKTMKVGINLRLGQLAPILVAVSVAAAPLAQILSSLGAGLVAVAAAAGTAAAALGVAGVSALLAFGQAAGVAALATNGLKDSLKALSNMQTKVAAGVKLTQGDLDNYNEAMQRLSPAARGVVTALGRVSGQFVTIRKGVQQRMFAGMGTQIRQVADTYLPHLRDEMNATASVMNTAGMRFAAFTRQASTVGKVRDVLAGNTQIVKTLTKAIVPLASAALTLFHAFQPLGQVLAQYVVMWSKAANRSVQASASSGQLARTVDMMAVSMRQAIDIISNIGSALRSTFSAVLKPGQTMLGMFERLTQKWDAWANSITGQSAMQEWAASAIPTLQALGRLIRDVAEMFGRLSKSGDAAGFIDQLRSILPPLEDLLTQLSATNAAGAFAEGIASIGKALADLNAGGAIAQAIEYVAMFFTGIVKLTTAFPPLSFALKGLIGGLVALQAIKLAATLTGLRQIPLLVTGITRSTKAVRAFTLALVGMESVGKAGQLGTALSNWGQMIGVLGSRSTTAATKVTILKGALDALKVTMLANPVMWIVGALGLAAAAMYKFRGEIQKTTGVWELYYEAQTRGAGENTQAAVDAASKDLLKKAEEAAGGFSHAFSKSADETAQHYRDMNNEILNSTAKLRDQFGSDTDKLVNKVREMGVSTETSTVDIIVALGRMQSKAGDTKLSMEELATLTARKFGQTEDALSGLANSSAWSTLAGKIDGMIGLYEAAYLVKDKMGNLAQTDQATYEKNLGKIRQAANNAKSSLNKVASSGGGGAVSNAYANQTYQVAQTAGKKTAAGYVSNFTAELNRLDPFTLIKGYKTGSYNTGKEIARYLAKGITSGSKNITKVANYIYKKYNKQLKGKIDLTDILGKSRSFSDNVKKYSKILAKGFDLKKFTSGAQLDASLAASQDYWQKRLDQILDFKANAKAALTEGRNLVGYFGFIPTPQEVQGRLDQIVKEMSDFANGVAALQEKGLSKELAREWLAAGPEQAGNLVKGLAGATKEQLDGINKSYSKIGTQADEFVKDAANTYFTYGEDTVKGYIAGIKSMRKQASDEMSKFINDLIAKVKKDLKANSPSGVFDDIGVDTMLGYIQGVDSMQKATLSTFDNIYGAVTTMPPATLATPTITPAYGTPGTPGYPAGGPPQVNVRVYVGNKEITDIVRTEVDGYDTTRARALLAGRRGG